MHPVPGIDHGNNKVLRHQVWRASRRMTDDDRIRTDCAKGVSRIQERLALFDARSRRLDQRGYRAQRFCSQLKRRPGAGGSLVKQKDDALAAQQRTRLLRIHAAGQPEQAQNVVRLKVFDPEQRTACGLIHRVRMGTQHHTRQVRPAARALTALR